MTGQQIIEAAMGLTNETYDESTWLNWINFCLDDLSQVAYRPGRKEVALTADTYEYDVPSDIQEIFGCVIKKQDGALVPIRQLNPLDTYSTGWKLQDKIILQKIDFTTGDTLVVSCYTNFAHLASVNETPELEEQYHELIVLYLASRSQQKEEELEERVDFYKEYLDRRAQYAEIRKRQAESWRRSVRRAMK